MLTTYTIAAPISEGNFSASHLIRQFAHEDLNQNLVSGVTQAVRVPLLKRNSMMLCVIRLMFYFSPSHTPNNQSPSNDPQAARKSYQLSRKSSWDAPCPQMER